jgi:hypothetical protein
MSKRLAVLTVLLLAGWAVQVSQAPQAQADNEVHACIPETEVAALSANGHRLSTTAVVCGYYLTYDGGPIWAPIARFRCYRDGVLFGDGTGGCRWQGTLATYRNGSLDHGNSFAVLGSTSTSYWSDSGRIYGTYRRVLSSDTLKWCQNDVVLNGIVHFRGITGIDYGTFNMKDTCTNGYSAGNHG